MFCPKCGYHINGEETHYCPYCGHALPDRTVSDPENIQNENYQDGPERAGEQTLYGSETVIPTTKSHIDEFPPYAASVNTTYNTKNIRKKNVVKISAAFIAAILIVCCTFVALGNSNTVDEMGKTTTVLGEYTYTVDGDFSENILSWTLTTHEFNGKETECLKFTLDDNIASKYSYFSWSLYHNDNNEVSNINKNEAVSYWCNFGPGDYTIQVKCYTTDSIYGNYTTYSGNFAIDGEVSTSYEWTYEGDPYGFEVTYSYDDYKQYASLNKDSRAVTDYSRVTDFVTDTSGTVQSISDNLISLYQEKKGSDADIGGQNFANYILAFVQCCYTYMQDSRTYEQDEYFAYPLETIYQGGGDCEDTSILSAAIYEAAGYDAAVGLLPGHAVVGVALNDYNTPTYNNRQEILSQTIDGKTYYAGETTATYFVPLGIMSFYKVPSLAEYEYIVPSEYIGTDQYGFYPME